MCMTIKNATLKPEKNTRRTF